MRVGESGRSLGKIDVRSSGNRLCMPSLAIIGCWLLLLMRLGAKGVSEQRSGKIWLALAAVLRTGCRDKREEVATKKEMMVSRTRVGMGQREDGVVRSKYMSRGEVSRFADGLDVECETEDKEDSRSSVLSNEDCVADSSKQWPQFFPLGYVHSLQGDL